MPQKGEIMKKIMENKKAISYIGLIFVVFVWGTGALTNKYFLGFYSPTFGLAWSSMVSVVALAIIFRKKLKRITKSYFKVAIPLGIIYTMADLFQKIGLQYTTPTVYSFLENLSCIVVPFLIWLLMKKSPSILQIIGSVVCLASAFILSGMGKEGAGFFLGAGEILCGLAGIFYGINIAGTSVYTKKLDSGLYILVLLAVECVLTLVLSLCFHFIKINGAPIEAIRFSFNPWLLLSRTAIVLISCALCWIIRTSSM